MRVLSRRHAGIISPSRAWATASAVAALALGSAGPAHAERRIFSYDPLTAVTRTLAEAGFTFVFEDGLFRGQKVRKLLSTHAEAEADLQPASERELGASLDALAGRRIEERDLYEILPGQQGAFLIRAACPESDRAWLAFGDLERLQDLKVHAFGRYEASGKIHYCTTLDFSWRGEWKLPERPGSRRPSLGPSPIPR